MIRFGLTTNKKQEKTFLTLYNVTKLQTFFPALKQTLKLSAGKDLHYFLKSV